MSVVIKYPVKKMNYKNMSYFGQIQVENERSVPNGAGLYRLDNYNFVMCEKVYKTELNGMTILGKGNSGKLTYYEKGFAYGPCVEFNDEKDIVFSNINQFGKQYKFKITLKKDGTYYISQYNDYGDFNHRVLSFKKGLFCLEYRNLEEKERTAVIEKKVGWNFKYPFVRMYLMPFEEKGVAPAKIIQNGSTYIYRGGAQSPSYITSVKKTGSRDNYNYYDFVMSKEKEDYNNDDKFGRLHNVFYECRLDGYAIDYIDDESLYFGEVDDNRLGGICCRKYRDYDYLGYAEHYGQSPDRTGMKVYKNGVIEFGSFVDGDNVRFEIHDDFLLIKSYDKKTMRGNYYKLYFTTFDLEEYSINNELLERIVYPEVTEEMRKQDNKKAVIQTELTGEELLDNQVKTNLSCFDYTVPAPGLIEIFKFKGKSQEAETHIPDVVTKIKSGAFNGDDSIKAMQLPRNLKELEEGSLNGMKSMWCIKFHGSSQISEIPANVCDCPSLREIGVSKSVKRIASGAFINCKSLTYISVYDGCEIEKGALPRKCKVHIIRETGGLFKSVDKKAGEEKIKSGKVVINEKPYKSKHKNTLNKKNAHAVTRPFKALAKPFGTLFGWFGKCFSSLGLHTNVFSIISFVVMLTTALMNLFKVNVAINEWATDNIYVVTNLFGFHVFSFVEGLSPQGLLLNLVFIVAILASLLVDLVINVLVLALFLLYIVMFFVIGLGYSLAIPIGMLVLAIVGLVNKKSFTNILILFLDLGLIVLFYAAIYM